MAMAMAIMGMIMEMTEATTIQEGSNSICPGITILNLVNTKIPAMISSSVGAVVGGLCSLSDKVPMVEGEFLFRDSLTHPRKRKQVQLEIVPER